VLFEFTTRRIAPFSPHAPTSLGAQSFSYDAAGNMTVGLEGRSIAYDGANRPVQVAWRGQTTDYLYGPNGPSG
jgi:hypothetical protein